MTSIKALIQNTGYSAVAQMVTRGANVVLFVMISRLLGPHEAGVYALASSYTLIAARLAFWGLDQLLVREVARDLQQVGRFFNNFLILRVSLSLSAWLALYVVTSFSVPGGTSDTRTIILLVGLSVIPENLINLCQSVFIAHQKMFRLVQVGVVTATVKLTGGLTILLLDQGMYAMSLVIVGASMAGMLFSLHVILARFVNLDWRVDLAFCRRQLSIARPFVLSGALYILGDRLGIVLLSLFSTEADVGIYNAALTVVSTVLLIPQAYRVALFPAMSKLYTDSRQALRELYAYSAKYMILVALPTSLSLTLAPGAVTWVFGEDFAAASNVLGVLAWVLPLLFLNAVNARLLVTGNDQVYVARSLGISLSVVILVNMLLVPRYGPLGTALARLASSSVMTALNHIYASRHIRVDWEQIFPIRSLWAIVAMALFLLLSRPLLPWALLVGGPGYFLVLYLTGAFSQHEKSLFKDLLVAASDRAGSVLGQSRR